MFRPNKIILTIVTKLLIISGIYAQIDYNSVRNTLENTSFQTGERLEYEVSYGLIKGGVATLTVGLQQVGNDWLYHTVADARTAGMADKLFTIRDVYESYMKIETGLPVKAIRNIREEKYWRYDEQLFHREKGKIMSLRKGERPAPEGVMDILGAFYFARRYLFKQQLQPGDTIKLFTYFDDDFYDIKIKFETKERVRTRFGKIDVLKFVPVIEPGSPFSDEKQMEIWFTDDSNYVPVKIIVDLPVGAIRCNLVNYDGLKNTERVLP